LAALSWCPNVQFDLFCSNIHQNFHNSLDYTARIIRFGTSFEVLGASEAFTADFIYIL
jgi:hypothetical protein